jgi:hypothetical protein
MSAQYGPYATVPVSLAPHNVKAFRLESANAPSGTRHGTDINRQRVVTKRTIMGLYPADVELPGVCRSDSGSVLRSLDGLPGPGAMTLPFPGELFSPPSVATYKVR